MGVIGLIRDHRRIVKPQKHETLNTRMLFLVLGAVICGGCSATMRGTTPKFVYAMTSKGQPPADSGGWAVQEGDSSRVQQALRIDVQCSVSWIPPIIDLVVGVTMFSILVADRNEERSQAAVAAVGGGAGGFLTSAKEGFHKRSRCHESKRLANELSAMTTELLGRE